MRELLLFLPIVLFLLLLLRIDCRNHADGSARACSGTVAAANTSADIDDAVFRVCRTCRTDVKAQTVFCAKTKVPDCFLFHFFAGPRHLESI